MNTNTTQHPRAAHHPDGTRCAEDGICRPQDLCTCTVDTVTEAGAKVRVQIDALSVDELREALRWCLPVATKGLASMSPASVFSLFVRASTKTVELIDATADMFHAQHEARR